MNQYYTIIKFINLNIIGLAYFKITSILIHNGNGLLKLNDLSLVLIFGSAQWTLYLHENY